MTRSGLLRGSLLLLTILLPLLLGCRTPSETVIGRHQGRDIVVTEAEIEQRAADKGLSRSEALRELRREQEMRLALDMQKEWKKNPEVEVEGARIRTQTDQPESPDEEEIADYVEEARKRRKIARGEPLEEPVKPGAAEEEDDFFSKEPQFSEEVLERLTLPESPPKFESSTKSEGWRELP